MLGAGSDSLGGGRGPEEAALGQAGQGPNVFIPAETSDSQTAGPSNSKGLGLLVPTSVSVTVSSHGWGQWGCLILGQVSG